MKFEQNHKLIKHSLGSQIAIGIEGPQAKDIFNLFWQWQATNGEPNEVSENFVWFWTTPKRLVKGVKAIVSNRLSAQGGIKGVQGGSNKQEFDVTVNGILSGIKEEHFVTHGNVIDKVCEFGDLEGKPWD